MKEAAAPLPLSLSCAGGGGGGGGGGGCGRGEGKRGGGRRLGWKTITTIKKCSLARSLPLAGRPGALDPERAAAPARTQQSAQPEQTRRDRSRFPAFGCGGLRSPPPPPLFISVGAKAAAFYFLFFVHSFSSPLPPRPHASRPGLPPSLGLQAGPPAHTAPLTAAPAPPALPAPPLAAEAPSIRRPRPAADPPLLPSAPPAPRQLPASPTAAVGGTRRVCQPPALLPRSWRCGSSSGRPRRSPEPGGPHRAGLGRGVTAPLAGPERDATLLSRPSVETTDSPGTRTAPGGHLKRAPLVAREPG